MKILIIGHGRHGKDTVSELLRYHYGLEFSSSSEYCAHEFIADAISPILGYTSVEECFNDRINYRDLWKALISAYNSKDKGRLVKGIMEHNDVYCGMRCAEEYEATKHIFDLVLYIEASARVGYVDPTFDIKFNEDEMVLVDNNEDLEHLKAQLSKIMRWVCIYQKKGRN